MYKFQPINKQHSLYQLFLDIRTYSVNLCSHLSAEDLQAQSMPDASPLKWHLAHTTWAFETFILKPHHQGYQVFDQNYEYLFNSYYNAIGKQFPRAQRGLLTRPKIQTVFNYRQHVDQAMTELFEMLKKNADLENNLMQMILLMLNHEQQHQELMLTDLKHLLFINPTYPSYGLEEKTSQSTLTKPLQLNAGLYTVGHENEMFYFDNEGPQHQHYVEPFMLHSNLVTNQEYLEFVESEGYQTASLWLSEAWQKINQQKTQKPYYWIKKDNQWFEYTLNGLTPLQLNLPVKHVNYFEANAFASWKEKRLPTEQEWEIASRTQNNNLNQMFGQLWQWTSSSYSAYPGFKTATGAIGEYNGKFMVNQYVLKGGSIVTPEGHIRPSYRNFFYPDASWQFTGIRLAETI